MKKIACILLSAVMLSSATACTFASSPTPVTEPEPQAVMMSAIGEANTSKTTDQRLADVAVKVKAILDIGDEYEEFSGNLWENELAPKWSLNWSRETNSISVEAFESGQVSSYYYYENNNSNTVRNFPPSFPATTRTQAQKAAEKFLKKVLNGSESVQFSERNMGRMDTETHHFTGTILINGLESPCAFSISVRAKDGKVVRFYRDCLDDSYIGGVPSHIPAAEAGEAGELLKSTLSLRTEYVLDGDKAVLRYLPESSDDYYVDAQTGKLINLTELYKAVANGETSDGASNSSTAFDVAMPEAAADKGTSGLTQVELEGVSKMEGVLSKEDLDRKIQGISQLGLNKYTFATANYTLDKETDEVSARLTYTRKDGDDTWRRTVTCDAKTGDLKSVWSSFPYNKDRTASISEEKAQGLAEEFLEKYFHADYSKTELYESNAWEEEAWNAAHSFQYAQKENGFFLPENSLHVSVDIEDGSISEFNRNWTEVKVFESPDGILSESEALDAWFNHYNLRMGYSRIPVKLDPSMPGASPLMDVGYSYFYKMALTYTMAEPDGVWASGLSAKTGEIITEKRYGEEEPIVYSDLDGYAGKEKVEALASYGIGWSGERCEPRKPLTQMDFVTLLVSADGYRYDIKEDDSGDLYRRAYSLGILAANERNDSQVLTRGDVVRMLLNCAGYRDVASLSGIFTCAYPDAATIPVNLLGYAAIAQGMGIVGAEQDFAAGKNATRGEAAEMLYNFMNR